VRTSSLRAVSAGLALIAVALAPASASAQGPRRPLPAPKPPPTFLLEPTDQLAFPGHVPGTLVTPEGDLFTGWAELTFNVAGQRTFDPRTHSLQDGRYPVVRLFRTVDGVLYELHAFQASVAGRPVVFARIQATNLATRTRRARVAAGVRYDGGEFGPRNTRCCIRVERFPRPRAPARDGLYWQPGAPFSAASSYSLAGGALLRDGQALVLFPPGGPGIRQSQTLGGGFPVTTRTEFGRTVYDLTLRPRQRRALVFRMPVEPLAPTEPAYAAVAGARFDQYRGIVVRYWRGLLAQAMRVQVPERKVVDTFYASIVNDAMSRYRLPASGMWVQAVNKLRYHAFWLRDASIITNTYDLVGLHRLARENLDFFRTWQRDDGLFISRTDEFDGFGQTLWAFGEHYRRTGNSAYAQEFLPVVRRAMEWFEAQRASDPLGLMPAVQTPLDNELVRGHLAGDNFWAVAGVAAAIDLARGAGDHASADRWQRTYDDFVDRVRANVFNAQRANRGAIPPSLDVRGGQDWGNLWASYPHVVLPPDSRVVGRTLARMRAKFREGIATYADRTLLHHYLGFRVFQTELLRNEQRKVVEGLFDELAHTSGSGAGFEAGARPFGDRVVDDTTVPHGWFAAEYVALVRNMLVREDGRDVRLMSAVSPAWLRPGKRISVTDAPTRRGRVSFALTATRGGAVLRWSAPGLAAGTRLRWAVPYAARAVSARGLNRRTGLITLPGRSGRLVVRWRLVGDDPTFAKRFNRLMRLYFNSTSGAVETASARPAVPSRPEG
jgi:hypothetical protein